MHYQPCPHCNLFPREDDQTTGVCASCVADARGEVYRPLVYPAASRLPTIGEGHEKRLVRVCGICRLAVRFDDGMRPIRLSAEELADRAVEPGLYLACADCIAELAPRLEARLQRTGVLQPTQRLTPQFCV